jgi:uncharacterized membrane-anchored protein
MNTIKMLLLVSCAIFALTGSASADEASDAMEKVERAERAYNAAKAAAQAKLDSGAKIRLRDVAKLNAAKERLNVVVTQAETVVGTAIVRATASND